MQIEKITICNLASIAGEQTIDFTREPLRSAALFAITGDTGAGKSTILDAICLALYNRAPRLEGVERIKKDDLKHLADAGAQQVQGNEPGTLLRRGEKEGFAQIVFRTLAGERYEATWKIRVKRTGNYDSPERKLVRLEPRKKTFDRKEEIDGVLAEAIGLTYEQFTRTVILAQNSFASFLRAPSSDKAVLLEKLTGTEIYGELSRAIYRLSGEADTAVRDLTNRMEGMLHDRLDEATLAEVTERQGLLTASLREAESRQGLMERQQAWYALYDQAATDVKAREGELTTANKQVMEARSDEMALGRYDELLPLRPNYQEIVMRRADIARLKTEQEQADTALINARNALREATSRLDTAHERTADAEKQRDLRLPDINRGHALGGEISVANDQLVRHNNRLALAEANATKRAETLRAKQEQSARVADKLSRAELHRQALSVHRLMFEKFDLIKDKLALLNTETQRNVKAHKQSQDLARKIQDLKKQGETAEQKQHDLQARLNTLKSELLIHRQTNQGRDSIRLQQAAAESSQRLQMLKRAALLWAHISEGYATLAERSAELRRCQTELSQLQLDAQKLEIEVTAVSEAYTRVNTAYTLSQSQNIVQLRKQLKEGTACPVCGATHHPYHTETERELGELLNTLTKEHQDLELKMNSQRKRLQTLREELAARAAAIEAKQKALEERTQRQDADVAEWADYAQLDNSFADCTPTTNRDARRMMIQLLTDNTTRAAEVAAHELSDYNFHQEHINRLNEEIAQLDSAMLDNRTHLDNLRTEAHIAQAASDDLQQTISLSDRACSELYTDLDGMITLSGWFTEWKNNADGLRLRLTNLNRDWNTTCTELEEARRQTDLLNEEIKSAEQNRDEAQRTVNATREERDAVAEALTRKREELRSLFGGSTPQKEAERLTAAVNAARAEEQLALTMTQKLQGELRLTEGRRDNLAESAENSRQRLQTCQQELDLQILRFNGSHSPVQFSELESLFADPRDWMALRRQIDALHRAVLMAEGNLDAARRELLRLQALPDRPAQTDDEARQNLQQALEAVNKQVDETRTELGIVSSRLLSHRNCMERAARLQQQLDQATDNAREWARLNQLYGSADGQKFRKLAQAHTFACLVAYANTHLAHLTPRYRLSALPGTLTLEVIDRDMFDEHRYVSSLSGGETFVVSLALALGLASLSSAGLSIGSLFIDEGFGNLDRDSLDLVMTALSNLENSQGRKVGVISHTDQIRDQLSPQIMLTKQSGGGSVITVRG